MCSLCFFRVKSGLYVILFFCSILSIIYLNSRRHDNNNNNNNNEDIGFVNSPLVFFLSRKLQDGSKVCITLMSNANETLICQPTACLDLLNPEHHWALSPRVQCSIICQSSGSVKGIQSVHRGILRLVVRPEYMSCDRNTIQGSKLLDFMSWGGTTSSVHGSCGWASLPCLRKHKDRGRRELYTAVQVWTEARIMTQTSGG